MLQKLSLVVFSPRGKRGGHNVGMTTGFSLQAYQISQFFLNKTISVKKQFAVTIPVFCTFDTKGVKTNTLFIKTQTNEKKSAFLSFYFFDDHFFC